MTHIREAVTTEDYELIARLADTIWREHYTPIIGKGQVDYMLERFQAPNAIARQVAAGLQYFLMIHQHQPAGYLAFEKQAESLFLSKIYVLKNLRGKGLGAEAMAFVRAQARAGGCQRISLTVNKYNAGSIAAYLKLGFRQEQPIQQDIGGGYIMDDYLMVLELQ